MRLEEAPPADRAERLALEALEGSTYFGTMLLIQVRYRLSSCLGYGRVSNAELRPSRAPGTHLQCQPPEPPGKFLQVHLITPTALQPLPNRLALAHDEGVASSASAADIQRPLDTRNDLLEAQLKVDGKLEAFDEGDVGWVVAKGLQVRESRRE